MMPFVRIVVIGLALAVLPSLAEAQNKKALVAGIVQVPSASPIHLVHKHGSDVRITAGLPGFVDVQFDRVQDDLGLIGTFLNNTVELEISIDGVLQPLIVQSFDILNGTVDVEFELALGPHQNVWIHRIDLYDESANRFATMGAKMKN